MGKTRGMGEPGGWWVVNMRPGIAEVFVMGWAPGTNGREVRVAMDDTVKTIATDRLMWTYNGRGM